MHPHRNPQDTRVTITCATCGTTFLTKRYRALDPARGKYCSKPCYYVGRRNLRRPLADRLWEKVARGATDECWPWYEAGRAPKGYGKIGIGGRDGQEIPASRAAWIVTFGPIPDGLWVLYHCDNPPCCNPAHLWLGTAADNTADMMRKGRHWTQRALPHPESA